MPRSQHPDQSNQQVNPGEPDERRPQAGNDPLSSGYSADGIDPDGRPVRRLDLPPMGDPVPNTADPTASGSHGLDSTQAMPLPVTDPGFDPRSPQGSDWSDAVPGSGGHKTTDFASLNLPPVGPSDHPGNRHDGMVATVSPEGDIGHGPEPTYGDGSDLPEWTAQQSIGDRHAQQAAPMDGYQSAPVSSPAYEQVGPPQDGTSVWQSDPNQGLGADGLDRSPNQHGGWNDGPRTVRPNDRQSVSEPGRSNGWLLSAGLALLLLVGAGAAYFFFRPTDEAAEAVDEPAADAVGSEVQEDLTGSEADASQQDSVPAEPVETTIPQESPDGNPLLVMEAADAGPLVEDEPYPLEVFSPPTDATYQVVVDGSPQGEPFDVPPVLQLPAGHYRIMVEMTAADGTATPSNEIEVYVLSAEPLVAGNRANLASVSVDQEGWARALERYSEYEAAGHKNLRLTPSDPYPSLRPGFWNIYVDGFGDDQDAATAYCEQFGLSVPDECFVSYFDPNAPADS